MDNVYFAFDFGPRDHGGVSDWWFPEYYSIYLGDPLGPYSFQEGVYRREFGHGLIVFASEGDTAVSLDSHHVDVFAGHSGSEFIVPAGDARILVEAEEP